MRERIEKIHQFLIEKEFLSPDLILDFDDDEPTMYFPTLNLINVNLDPDYLDPDYSDQLAEITCNEWTDLLEIFSNEEIAYFHELGHFADITFNHITFEELKACMEIRKEVQKEATAYAVRVLATFGINDELENIVLDILRQAEIEFYRNLPLEVNADKIARVLMNYVSKYHTF